MKRSDIAFATVLPALDFMVLVAGFMIAYYLRKQVPDFIPLPWLGRFAATVGYDPEPVLLSYQFYLPFILKVSFITVIIFALTGLYRLARFVTLAQTSGRVLKAVSLAFLVWLLIAFIRETTILPRLVIVYALVVAVFGMLLARWWLQLIRHALQRRGIGILRMAVLGETTNAQRVITFIGQNRQNGYSLQRQYTKADINQLYRAINRRRFDELIVADNQLSEKDIIELREHCIERRIGFMFVPSTLEMLTSHVIVRDMRGYPLIEVPVTPLEGWGYLVKRFVDVILSTLLLVLLSPLYLMLALVIYLDSPGPVLFKHRRLGRNLQPFFLYKFRTMKAEFCDGPGKRGALARQRFSELLAADAELQAEWEKYQKLKRDPRVTTIGLWLRKLSLDELPQIVNVWRGDVSLVGPRPIVESELAKYGRMQHRLSTIKPGVTGLWQVSGRNDTTYEERVRLDMVYVETWSLWLDVVILAKTALVLVLRRGAY